MSRSEKAKARFARAVAGLAAMAATAVSAAQPAPFQVGAPPPAAPVRPVAPVAPAPPLWVGLRADQVDLLRRTLSRAELEGFEHEAFTPANLDNQLKSPIPTVRRAGETALIAAAMRYARAVRTGRLTAGAFMDLWGLRPMPYEPTSDFVAAVSSDRLGAWLDGLSPPYAGYQSLRTALATYREIAAKGGWETIDEGPDLKLGVNDPRVADLRTRLAVEDPVLAALPPAAAPTVYDDAVFQAVTRAQKRYGLEPTGAVGKATLAALNVPIEDRIAQIMANMERWRWLPPSLPADRVQVNIAAAILTVFHADTPTLSMRAATGKPGDETPMLTSTIQSIVINPPWNVPSSIAAKELWPKERAHPGYLARNDFIVIHTPDGGTRLQQKAGTKAALGRVKFDFPNRYGVYLHDTPSRGAFGRYTRQVSHGCVRLEKPVDLANDLMVGDPQWTPDAVKEALDSGDTIRAALLHPISVYLLYWTAFVGPDGATNFRADPYGWDQALMDRMSGKAPPPATATHAPAAPAHPTPPIAAPQHAAP